MSSLGLDEAWLTISNHLSDELSIWNQVNECFNCPLQERGVVAINESLTLIVKTAYLNTIEVRSIVDNENLCPSPKFTKLYFNDQSSYQLDIFQDGDCRLSTIKSAINYMAPVYVAIAIYLLIAIISYVSLILYRKFSPPNLNQETFPEVRCEERINMTAPENRDGDQLIAKPIKAREKSLDAFRGFIIILMIFVNYGGGGYSFLSHAPWYGITMADIVFPSFIFIMGVSIALSIKSHLTRRVNFNTAFTKILIRSAKLFTLGLILNTDFTNLSFWRIPGVLQRFAVSYVIVATLHLISVSRANYSYLTRSEQPSWTQLVIIFLPETIIYTILITIYFYFTLWFNYGARASSGVFAGCPTGYQGPGGLESDAKYYNCTGGAANYIDQMVFGVNHIYQNPTSMEVYETKIAFDPEGLLGCTTSILLTAIGLIVGRIMIRHKSPYRRALRWFVIATICGLISFTLAATSVIPVSKNLWSMSFVLACASLATVVLTIFYLLIDVTGFWKEGIPFNYPGKNSILLYVGHEVGGRYFPFWYFVSESSHAMLLFRALLATSLWLLISVYLYFKRIFWTL